MVNTLEQEVKKSLVEGRLACASAFEIAREQKVSRQEVADEANRLRIRIVDCQLGCFQVKKATHDDLAGVQVNQRLAEEVRASLIDDHLPCPVAFKVARKVGVTPREVGDTATLLKVRIANCQLGCF